ncbi:cell division initiation protein [Fructobacillus pseudoficulneus]|uniref:Cell division initiation protein n=1 Tax=Fructobacillus pseudoficulneus TaxID=220714 RepID=A0A3F3H271_9LACO|nr:cell division regulator GpsB [Fructobacillus pseudoficulneus]GAP02270.1 cell division initiation protein [Fructobacillus pseudoficulneus]SEH36245.1 DivIVA domain-containing protein [Fructobacillus pseudoficulneus]
MAQVKYTQKDIYNRVFKEKRVGKGYDPEDVDGFLDDIIADYGVFSKRIEELQSQVGQLQNALKQAQEELSAEAPVRQAEPVSTPAPTPVAPVVEEPATPTNLDLIKRVANLERAVFGTENNANN